MRVDAAQVHAHADKIPGLSVLQLSAASTAGKKNMLAMCCFVVVVPTSLATDGV